MKYAKNGVAVIGIDHGYGNIKTANTVTQTGVAVYETEPAFEGNILRYNGRFYKIGEGHKSFLADKSEDEDFFICTLYGIARELSIAGKTEADVHIAAGLPTTWIKSQRESFRKYLTEKENVEFGYRDKEYRIRISGCSVYPQGYTAVIDRLHEMSGMNMIADIGNGTMNIMCLNNRKVNESKCRTEKLGVNQCVINAQNAVRDVFAVSVDEAVIEEIIRTGTADISKKYLSVITNVIRAYCGDIFTALGKYEYNADIMKLWIVGGGSTLVRNFGTYDAERVIFITDVKAAARGYENLALSSVNKRC